MPVVAAFVAPGLPHLMLKPEVAPWGRLGAAATAAGRALADAHPDVVAIYSTQWVAVLDQLWQTRPRLQGVHVDDNWYEWGELPYDIQVDVELAQGCVTHEGEDAVRSRGVDYDGFPIDTGTIVAAHFLTPQLQARMVITSNNIYHDWSRTEQLGRLVRTVADKQGKRLAVVGVGGLSARMSRSPIDLDTDRLEAQDDAANRRVLTALESGDADRVRVEADAAAKTVPTDSGLKHLAFVLGALGGELTGATVHGYEPIYGTGGAVVEVRR